MAADPNGGTAVQRVVAELRARILSGALPAGSRLNQRELAHTLGVSRIPVREALRALDSERLVEIRDNSGAVVASLSADDLQELYELRMAIEPMVSRMALPAVGRAELIQMRRWLDSMRESTDVASWLQANERFHRLLYEKAARPRMVDLCRQLRQQTDRYLRVHLPDIESPDQLQTEHELIFEAVERGDGTAVEALVKAHLSTTYDRIFRHLLRAEMEGVGEEVRQTSWSRGRAQGDWAVHRK